MADFRRALQAFGEQRLSVFALAEAIDRVLRERPRLGRVLLRQLEEARGAAVVDDEQYRAVRECIVGALGGSAERPAAATDPRPARAAPRGRADDEGATTTTAPSAVDLDLREPRLGADGLPSGVLVARGAIGLGSVLRERYVLEEELGRGGMGVVYKALDRYRAEAQLPHPYVAIKVLGEQYKNHPKAFIALTHEADRQQRLVSPHIVKVEGFDRDGDLVYMVMELLEGQPLNKFIRGLRLGEGRGLDFARAWPLIRDLGQALQTAHEYGIVHSDFKPGNCFLRSDGTVKVLDFGIARAVPPRVPTAAEAFDDDSLPDVGGDPSVFRVAGIDGGGEKTLFRIDDLGALTVPYASFEMLRGEAPEPRDDLYALACVAYELLAGQHPFRKLGADVVHAKQLVPEPIKGLPRRQMRALERALACERADRYPDVRSFLRALEDRRALWAQPRVLVPVIAVMLAVPGYFFLEHRGHVARMDAVARNLTAPASSRAFDDALAAATALDYADRGQLVQRHGESIGARLRLRVEALAGDDDFGAARQALKLAGRIGLPYDLVTELDRRVEQRRADRVGELDLAIEQCAGRAECLAAEGSDGYAALLVSLRALEPRHVKLRRDTVASNFAAAVHERLDAGEIERAATVLAAGLHVLPAATQLTALEPEIKRRRSAAQGGGAGAVEMGDLMALVTEPRFDGAWMRALEAGLAALPAADPARAQWLARVAELYGREFDLRVEGKNFDGARTLLADFAASAAAHGRADTLARLRTTLATSEQAWRASRRAAELDERKARVHTLIDALRLAEARKRFDALSATLPPADPFIADTRARFAHAYQAQAEEKRERAPLAAADDVVEALRYTPDAPALVALADALHGRLRESAQSLLANADGSSTATLRELADGLRGLRPAAWADTAAGLRAAAATRLAAWPVATAPDCAEVARGWGSALGVDLATSCPLPSGGTLAARIEQDIDRGALSAAGAAFERLSADQRSAAIYARARNALAARRAAVNDLLKGVQRAVAAQDEATARGLLEKARALWIDREPAEWPQVVATAPRGSVLNDGRTSPAGQ